MKRFGIVVICLLILLVNSASYIQGSMFQAKEVRSSKAAPHVQMAVLSPRADSTVNGDFFVTGIASDKGQEISSVDVTFTSLYDKEQTPIKEYTANYNPQGKWSTHVKQGDLPDDVYAVMVTVHTEEGDKRYLFSTVVVDSSLTSKNSTF